MRAPRGFEGIDRTADKTLQPGRAKTAFLQERAVTLCKPAFTDARMRNRASMASEPSVGLLIRARSSRPPIVRKKSRSPSLAGDAVDVFQGLPSLLARVHTWPVAVS
jgi:hypothetical protein